MKHSSHLVTLSDENLNFSFVNSNNIWDTRADDSIRLGGQLATMVPLLVFLRKKLAV
jgi:hypothetical protein